MPKQNYPRILPTRLLSLLLAVLMTVSLFPVVSAAEAEETEEAPLPAQTDPSLPEGTDSQGPSYNAEAVLPGEEAPADDTQQDILPEEDLLPEEDTAPEEDVLPEKTGDDALPQQAVSRLEITSSMVLKLEYDDRYSFADDMAGMEIVGLESTEVTSYQVSMGANTGVADEAVLTLDGSSGTDVIASGTGTATVLLAPTAAAMEARALLADEEAQYAPGQPISLIEVEVIVSPARLTLMFLAGQSNAEGLCGTSYRRQDSVLCPEGKVYSTYAPRNDTSARYVTGISSYTGISTSQLDAILPGSLTGTASLAGTDLVYPLYALTQDGNGKTGPDAALAYEWNRLTGDKVWVINTAAGSSAISQWVPGGTWYERSVSAYTKAISVLKAEISAGHYTAGDRLLFWQHGETDHNLSASDYLRSFKSMRSELANTCGIQYFGLIMPRAVGTANTANDVAITGPRAAQYYMGNSTGYYNVYVVSNVNEQWYSDAGTVSYFSSAYPSGSLTYPLRSNTTLSALPTQASQTHDGIHYTQVGHNENGLDAARNLYYAIYGGGETNVSVTWRNSRYEAVTSLNVTPKTSETVVPVVYPLYRSKEVTHASSNFSYDAVSGKLTIPSSGSTALRSVYNGKTVASAKVSASYNAAPVLSEIYAVEGGVKLTWGPVSGASKYRVYRKTSTTSWSLVSTQTDTKFVDTNVENGESYTYTVRSIRNGTLSSYDTIGLTICYLSEVKIKLSNTVTGVQISWTPDDTDCKYTVYRRSDSGTWTPLTTCSSRHTSYVDTSAKSGTSYTYCVRKTTGNNYSAVKSASITHLSVPVLNRTTVGDGQISVSWTKVSGATGYSVWRKTSGSSWSKIATISGGSTLSYTDKSVANNTSYIYTVRASKGSVLSSYDAAGLTVTYLAAPTVSALSNTPEGITVKWKAIDGAHSYQIYRKAGSGSRVLAGTVTDGVTVFTDTGDLASGTVYTYTVRALNDAARSYYKAGRTITRLEAPVLTGAVNTTSGVSVRWQKVTGATGYSVYRKTSGSGWSRIATVSGGSSQSYIDQKAVSGTQYTYTVRASKDSILSDYDAQGVSSLYLAAPVIKTLSASAKDVSLNWAAITGAEGYEVYRKSSGTGWTLLATVSETTYVDSSELISGTAYTYTLRAVTGDSRSHYYSGKSVTWLAAPVLTGVTNSAASSTLRWEQVTGATGYTVWRKTGSSSWEKIATISSGSTLSYTDKNVNSGVTYTYTVRAVKGSLVSAYDVNGVTNTFLTPPVMTGAYTAAGGVSLRWNALSGATGYRIYRRVGSSAWTLIDTVTGGSTASYLDTTDLVSGTTYTYAIRALAGNSVSAYKVGKSAAYLEAPGNIQAENLTGGIQVSWDSVDTADSYLVYRKQGSSSWVLTATLSADAVTWLDSSALTEGSSYTYTVRAKSGSLTSYFYPGALIVRETVSEYTP